MSLFFKQTSQAQFSSEVFHLCLNFREANVAQGFPKLVWQLFKTRSIQRAASVLERAAPRAKSAHKRVAFWGCRSNTHTHTHTRATALVAGVRWSILTVYPSHQIWCEIHVQFPPLERADAKRAALHAACVLLLHREALFTGGGGRRAQEQNSEHRRQKVTVHDLTLRLITGTVYECSKQNI